MFRWHRVTAGSVLWLGLLLVAPVRAEAPPDPLRFVPDQAHLLIKLEQPRGLAETVLALDLAKQLRTFSVFREFYDSTNYRRFLQIVGYFEKELGAPWPELVDRLAGGGAVLAVQFGEEPPAALVVVQARDEELLKKFAKSVRTIIEGEMLRAEAKDRLATGTYRNIEIIRAGKDFHAAIAGSALLISNRDKTLHMALDRHLDGGKHSLATLPRVAEARQLLPVHPFAWMWLNLESIRQLPNAKGPFEALGTDPPQLVLFGGLSDQARHTPFLCAGLGKDGNGLMTTIRTPRGLNVIPPALAALHMPAAQDGSLPLLEPRGVLFSTSFILDPAKFWEHRVALLGEVNAKGLEEVDQNPVAGLVGLKLSKLLGQTGPHQRFVAAHQANPGYKTKPGQKLPAFAVVLSMRDPDGFSRSVSTALRTAALASRGQTKLRLAEEKHGDLTLVGYRFPEDGQAPEDPDGGRFNFSPCFVAVGDQFVMSSTLELGHELVDLLQKEAKSPVKKNPAAMQTQFYSAGGADFLKAIEEQLLATTILGYASAPCEAQVQVRNFINMVRGIGVFNFKSVYGEKDFRLDMRFVPRAGR